MTTIPTGQRSDLPATLAELLDELEDRPALAIEAALTVEVDGYSLAVVGYDDVVAVDFPSLSAIRSLWREATVETMDAAAVLSSVGLTAEFRLRGVPLARVGDDADPSPLARRLGLGPVELVPEGPLLALTRRRG